jgi:hypothetical protein
MTLQRVVSIGITAAAMLSVGCEHPVDKTSEINTHMQFTQKLECKKFEKNILDDDEQDKTALITIVSIFYSSRMNSCLVAKRSIYLPTTQKVLGVAELLEIDDVLEDRMLWSQSFVEAEKADAADSRIQAEIEAYR